MIEMTFTRRHWALIAHHTPKQIKKEIEDALKLKTQKPPHPEDTLRFEVSDQERDAIRQAATVSGVYRELKLPDMEVAQDVK